MEGVPLGDARGERDGRRWEVDVPGQQDDIVVCVAGGTVEQRREGDVVGRVVGGEGGGEGFVEGLVDGGLEGGGRHCTYDNERLMK